jgi:hypothetical protein
MKTQHDTNISLIEYKTTSGPDNFPMGLYSDVSTKQ